MDKRQICDMDDLDVEYSCSCVLCCCTSSCICARRLKVRPKKKKSNGQKKKFKLSFSKQKTRQSEIAENGEVAMKKNKEGGKQSAENPYKHEKLTPLQQYDKLCHETYLREIEESEVYKGEAEVEKLVEGAPRQTGSLLIEPYPELLIPHAVKCDPWTESQELHSGSYDNVKDPQIFVEKEPDPSDQIQNTYDMSHKRRGRALILLQSEIYPFIGSQYKGVCTDHRIEADVMKTLFTSFGFDVTVKDCGACETDEILKVLSIAAEEDHSDADCFACCVLGHGAHQELYCTNRTLEVEDLTSAFKGDTCQSLAGKPKLFFVQFCQGQEIGLSQVVTDNVVSDTSTSGPYHIPTEADIMISLANVQGDPTPSSSKSISPYVLALSQIFTDHYADMDLLQMMTRVTYAMVNETEKDQTIPFEPPQIMSMLTKDLYFPPQPQSIPATAMESMCVECDIEASAMEMDVKESRGTVVVCDLQETMHSTEV